MDTTRTSKQACKFANFSVDRDISVDFLWRWNSEAKMGKMGGVM
jgi:hypothetical protein